MVYNKIGIICAIEEEKVEVEKQLHNIKTVWEQAGLTFEEGSAGTCTVYLVTAGIGKVNSAMCTQIMIDRLDPDILINIGMAGALDPTLEQGDIIISKEAQQHDFDCSDLDEPAGLIPRMETSIFQADETLIGLAEKACKTLGLHYLTGKVVSGDQFIGNSSRKKKIVNIFQGTCCEMEGAAIAHVCFLNRKPWLILRSITDKADGDAQLSYPEFKKLATCRTGQLFHEMMERF